MKVRRFPLVLVVVFALLVPLPVLAQETATPDTTTTAATPAASPVATPAATGDGVISGKIQNGTPDGGSVEGLTVTLTRFRGTTQVPQGSVTTGPDGSFEFTDLPVNEGEAFLATVTYEGVEYSSDLQVLSENPNSTANIAVYEPTDDPSVLTIQSRGLVIAGANRETSAIEVFEIISLDNNSHRAYVGQDGKVLTIPLPPGATQIIPQPGFYFGMPEYENNTLVTTGAITPGSHDAMFAYLVPYSGTKKVLDIGTAMPTGSLSILVPVESLKVSSPSMQDAGTARIADTEYHVLSTENPVVGDVIAVTVSDLPKPASSDASRGPLYAAIAAVVGLSIAGALIYQVIRRRQQPALAAATGGSSSIALDADPERLEDERLALAEELNQLEEEYAAGKIDQETYDLERAEILEEMRTISRRMRGLEGADD